MFKNNKFALSTLAFGMLASTQAFAASDVTLNVTGTITPVACTPTLGTSGINYGNISVADLSETARTSLDMKTVSFNVDCAGASAPFAIKAVDNAIGTALDSATGANFGLGRQGTASIGQYTLNLANDVQGDGAAVVGLISTDGTTWAAAPVSGDRGPAIKYDGTLLGFADTAAATAVKPLSTLSGTLQVRPEIGPLNTLDTTANFDFSGSATLVVEYL
ncbi:beta-fimbriae putative major subunit [Buttiauxella gaviniae ATCC 51604]|uniref:Beta-fimbriae putative major subunit n=1 Tax=Buttiauxella gaviniae ATCC 51604 TaxID=1354253 RepID=A0A1B7I624_9ENTR|nr:DUF1120 domain-containing protein [Buttiauxella gaviniae]OAT23893.1 beta-fimbriae putative major subunit [Buttiauxella gaviniae ATCC 51604]